MGRDRDAARADLTVSARGLRAQYGDRVALDGFDLDLAPGEIVGLLGPNGAGKTSALRLLATGRRPAAGSITIHGLDPQRGRGARRQIRRRSGIAGDEPIHIDALTGWENAVGLTMAAGLTRADAVSRVASLLETFALTAEAHRPVSQYSMGMRRRLLLVEALAHDPALLLLDEPTAGLDPEGRIVLADVLASRARHGAAIVLATHDVQGMERLCHRVMFLLAGRTVLEGRPAELLANLKPAAVRQPDLGDVFLKATGLEMTA
jgi:ABC-2 type transport system ATP-binding protein